MKIEFAWYCSCGAAWKMKARGDDSLGGLLDSLHTMFESEHRRSGHKEVDGRTAAAARRKAEKET